MDTILSQYQKNKHSVPSTCSMELEIRYKDITIDRLLELLKTIKRTSIEHILTNFIDAVIYKKN